MKSRNRAGAHREPASVGTAWLRRKVKLDLLVGQAFLPAAGFQAGVAQGREIVAARNETKI